MEIFFGAMLAIGVLYFALMIVGISELLDIDGALGLLNLDALFGINDSTGFGCMVISAFMVGFGGVGLVGLSAGWSLPAILGIALVLGVGLGRGVLAIFRTVYAAQSQPIKASLDDLIGQTVRVTLDAQPGQTAEAIIETGEVARFPIREINRAALKRGDLVEVVDVQGRYLRVKKKHG